MTLQKGVKKIRGARPSKKGASASAARRRVTTDLVAAQPREAVVVNTNLDSARLRLFGGEGEVTFRSPDLRDVVPGHVLTVVIEKRWTSRGEAYASGTVADARIDIPALGLEPLPLEGGEPTDEIRTIGSGRSSRRSRGPPSSSTASRGALSPAPTSTTIRPATPRS